MKIQNIILSAFIASAIFLGGCSSNLYHDILMKGQIVKVDDSNVIVCVGTRDGAKAGDRLNVMRSVFQTDVVEEGESNYALQEVGRIEVIKIVNEHYAQAKLIKGEVNVNDVAEMKY